MDAKLQHRIHWTLRITTALCFIGHGAWGVLTRKGWAPFFAVVGIGEEAAYTLMPLVGAIDIAMALLLLWRPRRIILLWMTLWAIWTALLRPLSGTPGPWEFIERAGNFVPPLMLLIMAGKAPHAFKAWFGAYAEPLLKPKTLDLIFTLSMFGVGLLLIGHGALQAVVQKPMFIEHWASIGLPADISFITIVGLFEIALGALVFLLPVASILWLVLFWKLFTEFLFVTQGGVINLWEWIERAGDYGLPIVMLMILKGHRNR